MFMREFALLEHIYRESARAPASVLIGPGDDMAMVELRGKRLLATVDQLIDGRHVDLTRTPIELIGRKAVTRSLSDVAAMAASPVACLAAAVLPPDFGEQRANALFDALRRTAERFDCPVIGGDIAVHRHPSHPLVCSVTVFAEPSGPRVVERGGAQVGDVVCVTGALGGSVEPDGLGRHLTFEPRIAVGQELLRRMGERLHAMIDISDGLGRDASHIARMSSVQIRLRADQIPCNPGCDWRRAVGDGEDYELCFACAGMPPEHVGGVPVHAVGEVVPAADQAARVLVEFNGQFIDADEFGWQHESRPNG